MIKLDWVRIPAGRFRTGLSNDQRTKIRSRLRAEFEIEKFDPHTLSLVESLVEKYQRRSHDETLVMRYVTTAEEKRLKLELGDRLVGYLEAEADIELIPLERQLWLPEYYIARFPVTHAQSDLFFRRREARDYAWHEQRIHLPEDLPDMPEEVTWEAADVMAHWLGGRLPTPWEWEKAARGKDGRLYPWGNVWKPNYGNFDYAYQPKYSQEHGIYRAVVDAYPDGASPYGVLDMVGNLAEWTTAEMVPLRADRPYPLVKGETVKYLAQPEWYWTLAARTHLPPPAIGFRPVLSRWQRQHWNGASVARTIKKK